MKSQPNLLRLLNPPSGGSGSLWIPGEDLQSVTHRALSLHLTKSVPTSAPRTSHSKIQMTTMHPCQSLVAYVLVTEEREKKATSRSVIVQNTKTSAVVWSMSLSEIASTLFEQDILFDRSEQRQQKNLKEIGQLQRLDFFDPSTLYWSGYGVVADTEKNGQRWSNLFVQLTNCIIIVNLRRHSISISKDMKGDRVFKPIVAHITPESLGGSMISSNALPISQYQLIAGTTDGFLRIYDWKSKTILHSIKVLTIKNDSIVHICSANKYGTPEQYSTTTKRIICLSKKGTAYLMELEERDYKIRGISPPLCKFEGGSVPTSMANQDDETTSMEHILVQYCGFRNLFLWSAPSKNKGKLMVWDLSKTSQLDLKQAKKNEIPKADPILFVQFPYDTLSHTIFNGWFHESVPMECIASAAVTKEGDFQILLSPLYGSGSTMKHPYSPLTVLSVNLNQIVQRDMHLDVNMKVHSVWCPSLRDSSTFYFGTSVGILLVKLLDGNLIPVPGGSHAHLNANFGSLGKAVFSVRNHEILYGSLEPPGGSGVMNPIGQMESKNILSVYESPAPLHLPPEIHKRPIRLLPALLPSPSGNYLCCFWKEEMRYEILHIDTMLERVKARGKTTVNPLVAGGNGVSSFAWVGDDDIFGLLYNPEQDSALKTGGGLSVPQATLGKELANVASKMKLKDIASLNAIGGTAGKLQSLKGLQEIARDTGRMTSKIGRGGVKLTKMVARGTVKGTSKLAKGTTKLAVATKRAGIQGTRAVGGTLGLLKKKSEKNDADTLGDTSKTTSSISTDEKEGSDEKTDSEYPWVELRALVKSTRVDGSISATASNMGKLSLRTGNRNPPCVLFGGPVLCVGSKFNANDEGLAYFYTQNKGERGDSGTFVSSGPAFPCPDLLTWDEDGRLCAVFIQNRVSIYLSEEPEFVMLGTARIGSSTDVDVHVTSAQFIHGTLYCSTRSSVQCIFLGDLYDGVCHLDVYTLSSSDVSTLPSSSIVSTCKSLIPPTIPVPLYYPTVLGYQNGSLMVSSVFGIQAIPLGFPLLRIGSLIAAGHPQRAELWFDEVPEDDHEALATFLERRGTPELALQLAGVSLETTIDLCMKYGFMKHGFTERLEDIVERNDLRALRSIDMGRGVSANIFGPEDHGVSITVSIGAYLLSQGKVDLVTRLALGCLALGDEGKRDGFMLASLLLSVQGNDSMRMIRRAVENAEEDDWPVGAFVHDHILASK